MDLSARYVPPGVRFGVDEAGKGPVLGSMFAAAVCADEEDLPAAVGDSKTISPSERERLSDRIREVATVAVAEITVERIDDPTTDMNTLTVSAHATALSSLPVELSEDLPGTLDACDVDEERFRERVTARLDAEADVLATHGADETDPLVGAASIVAKVERDSHVTRLSGEFGDVGSGYPSDPTTRSFLRQYVDEHGELPDCARQSWSTCRDVLAAAEQGTLSEFE